MVAFLFWIWNINQTFWSLVHHILFLLINWSIVLDTPLLYLFRPYSCIHYLALPPRQISRTRNQYQMGVLLFFELYSNGFHAYVLNLPIYNFFPSPYDQHFIHTNNNLIYINWHVIISPSISKHPLYLAWSRICFLNRKLRYPITNILRRQ